MSWLNIIGLCLDLVGAVFLAWGLIISEDSALQLGQSRHSGDTREENLKLPQVRDRLRQSRNAKIGVSLLVLGFGLQIFASLPVDALQGYTSGDGALPIAFVISAESVFWTASTVAQCLVAILAFGAFVVAWRVDGMRESVIENFGVVRDKVKDILEKEITEKNENNVRRRVTDWIREHKDYETWVRTGNPRTEFSARYLLHRYRHAVMLDGAKLLAWQTEIDAVAAGSLKTHFEILDRHFSYSDAVLNRVDLIRNRLKRTSVAIFGTLTASLAVVATAEILEASQHLGVVALSAYALLIAWSLLESGLVAAGSFWEPPELKKAVEGDSAQRL